MLWHPWASASPLFVVSNCVFTAGRELDGAVVLVVPAFAAQEFHLSRLLVTDPFLAALRAGVLLTLVAPRVSNCSPRSFTPLACPFCKGL